ncbi:class I SAM-dependent methyltransferase [Paenibacillus sp. 481]|uniref:class I SAM-dependent methyltransferase n=1 Tax=Paenibacillus sp. 481 TaxID=2835869 RepID=UPI001E53A163|nr:class I SAM-dependent methyltransferase [Paenibacillus sp. 481]UHA75747.1 class I SAM-dependent methyltransferase [Paenibacillus sp. 481]
MSIHFHDEKNRSTYAKREADATWIAKINDIVNVRQKQVVDIGCGGGIYSKALAEMGAECVTGVDFSEQMLVSARENSQSYPNIQFSVGNALDTTLPCEQYDIVLQRAIIHHIQDQDLQVCFEEAYRLLKQGGTLVVQNRTPEDCLLEGTSTHIRGYFFSTFPELATIEVARRHSNHIVVQALQAAGFKYECIEVHQLWETRQMYSDIQTLTDDLLHRTGRSILHELSDVQLAELVQVVREQLSDNDQQIVEKDRWTIWKAVKEGDSPI